MKSEKTGGRKHTQHKRNTVRRCNNGRRPCQFRKRRKTKGKRTHTHTRAQYVDAKTQKETKQKTKHGVDFCEDGERRGRGSRRRHRFARRPTARPVAVTIVSHAAFNSGRRQRPNGRGRPNRSLHGIRVVHRYPAFPPPSTSPSPRRPLQLVKTTWFRDFALYIYIYICMCILLFLRFFVPFFFLVSRYPDSQHSILARMPLNQYAGRHSFSSRNSSRTDGTVRLSSWIFFFDSTGLSLLTFEFGIASRGVDYIFVDHRFIQGLGRFRKYRLDFPRQSLLSSLPT